MSAATQPQEGESLVARTLRTGFPWLRFPDELEREFVAEYRQSRRRLVRIGVCIALATIGEGGFFLVLARSYQMHTVAVVQQTLGQAAQGHGHAVDFRRKGFSDKREVQRGRVRWIFKAWGLWRHVAKGKRDGIVEVSFL